MAQKTPWELEFAKRVLAEIRDLDFAHVRRQTPFRDFEGRTRYIDFTISEGEHVRLAIEVDGFDKCNRGSGMSRAEFEDWLTRQNAMQYHGWRLCRIPCSVVKHDPERCIQEIELLLKAERAPTSGKASPGVTTAALGVAEKRRAMQQETLRSNSATARLDKLRSEYEIARTKLEVLTLTALEQEKLLNWSSAREKELSALKSQLAQERKIRHEVDTENKEMKSMQLTLAIVVSVIVAGMAGLVYMLQSNKLPAEHKTFRSPFHSAPHSRRKATILHNELPSNPPVPTLDWSTAREYVGKKVVIKGKVRMTNYSTKSQGRPTFLNIGNGYPVKSRLDVIIWGNDLHNWNEPPVHLYFGKTIVISGIVKIYNGIPRIEVSTPEQIKILD